jgi:hypothetical protein
MVLPDPIPPVIPILSNAEYGFCELQRYGKKLDGEFFVEIQALHLC